MAQIAVFDFGTNLFNVLVAELKGGKLIRVFAASEVALLGKDGGLESKNISTAALERGLKAYQSLLSAIKPFRNLKKHVVATSAFRNSINGFDALSTIVSGTATFEIVEGNREAELIYKGILASGVNTDNSLSIDIGGGSIEFIGKPKNQTEFKQSLEIGMQRAISLFPISDPISKTIVDMYRQWIQKNLSQLHPSFYEQQFDRLIGCAGTFDTLKDAISTNKSTDFAELELSDIENHCSDILNSTRENRFSIKGMLPLRVDFYVLSLVFIQEVIKKFKPTEFYHTNFALREGIAFEMLIKNAN